MAFPIQNPPETEEEIAELRRQTGIFYMRKKRKQRISLDLPLVGFVWEAANDALWGVGNEINWS